MERTASIQGATILAFPAGGRRVARNWPAEARTEKAPGPAVVDCDAWYHQAAIRDDEPRGNA